MLNLIQSRPGVVKLSNPVWVSEFRLKVSPVKHLGVSGKEAYRKIACLRKMMFMDLGVPYFQTNPPIFESKRPGIDCRWPGIPEPPATI